MGRTPCCDKSKVKRGPWSPEEDETLKNYLHNHGTGGNWITLPQRAGLKRCGKSCRLRWLNYLRPDIKHGAFSTEEDNIICTLYTKMGSRWSVIASHLPGRTDNDVKNHWNTKLKKKLMAAKTNIIPTSNIMNNNNIDDQNNAKTVPSSFHYNPSFSALLTQTLPTMALPFLADHDHIAAASIANSNIPFARFNEGSPKFFSSSQVPQEDSGLNSESSISSLTKNINNSVTWADNGGCSSQIEEIPMEMGNGNYSSYEVMSGLIWPPQETVLQLEALPNISHANLFSFYYC